MSEEMAVAVLRNPTRRIAEKSKKGEPCSEQHQQGSHGRTSRSKRFGLVIITFNVERGETVYKLGTTDFQNTRLIWRPILFCQPTNHKRQLTELWSRRQ
jgi:hypothetical protein